MFELIDHFGPQAVIKVIGIGGAGGNALEHIIKGNVEGLDFININTDAQVLKCSIADTTLQIGESLTKGLGAGADPSIGKQAAIEDRERIAEVIDGADIVIITAGMGGGTGSGATPVVANLAREKGILTVGVVTKPFNFEGRKRTVLALTAIEKLKKHVDTLIVIPNQKVLEHMGGDASMIDAFTEANQVVLNAVQGITDLITRPGMINVDYADVCAAMSEMGMALMGSATATGSNRAIEAAQNALLSPLLEGANIHGAAGVIVNITAGADLTLGEFSKIGDLIYETAGEDAVVIIGSAVDPNAQGDLRVTVVFTGLEAVQEESEEIVRYRQTSFLSNAGSEISYEELEVPAFLRKQVEGEQLTNDQQEAWRRTIARATERGVKSTITKASVIKNWPKVKHSPPPRFFNADGSLRILANDDIDSEHIAYVIELLSKAYKGVGGDKLVIKGVSNAAPPRKNTEGIVQTNPNLHRKSIHG